MAVLLCRCLAGRLIVVSFIIYRGRPPEGGERRSGRRTAFSAPQRMLRHLSHDLLILQNLIECPANDFVAFARSGFQPPAVDDLELARVDIL